MPVQLTALFQDPSEFERLERKPIQDAAGLTEVWGKKLDAEGLSLSTIEADGNLWTADRFRSWLDEAGYSPTEILKRRRYRRRSEPGTGFNTPCRNLRVRRLMRPVKSSTFPGAARSDRGTIPSMDRSKIRRSSSGFMLGSKTSLLGPIVWSFVLLRN